MVNFCKSKKSLVGKTAIVTGSNTATVFISHECVMHISHDSLYVTTPIPEPKVIIVQNYIGIGYETALEFAKRGCRVILACRNQEKATAARKKIVQATGNENVVVKLLNLSSLSSVKSFAKDINDNEDSLDLLINNAGAAALPDEVTEDGLFLEMQCNYLAPFLLTVLLLDLLKGSAPSRIVNVSSYAAAFIYGINVNELNSSGWTLYARTKLCQIYFTQELAKRLEGANVTTYSLHPGSVYTDLFRFTVVGSWIASMLLRSAEQGAQTTIYCALEDGIEQYSGEHFEDCHVVKAYYGARDEETRKKLWDVSEEMVGLRK